MTSRSIAANFVTAFATGWPENQPDIMVLSLTTNKGVAGFRAQQGTGAADRENHQADRRAAGGAEAGS